MTLKGQSGTPRLKQVLGLAARRDGVRANKVTVAELAMRHTTLCTLLQRYTENGLLFRHGVQGHGSRSGLSYWYTPTQRGHEVLADMREGRIFSNEHLTLTGRVRRFYLANPDEELEYADLAVKFGEPVARVRAAVSKLMREGLVYSAHVVRAVRQPPALRRAA